MKDLSLLGQSLFRSYNYGTIGHILSYVTNSGEFNLICVSAFKISAAQKSSPVRGILYSLFSIPRLSLLHKSYRKHDLA